jgi:hypothetical protein
MGRTLVPELKVLYPSITTLSIAHSLEVRVDSMKTDTVTLAVLEIRQTPVSCREGENRRMAESPRGSEEVEAHYRIMSPD